MDFEDGGFAGVVVKANEFSHGIGREIEGADDGFLLRSAGEFAGFFHTRFDSGFVESNATLTAEERGEVEREAESIVELEGVFWREDFAFRGLFEFLHATIERFVERLFFRREGLFHHLGAGADLREDFAKLSDERVDEFREEVLFAGEAEGAAVFDGAS